MELHIQSHDSGIRDSQLIESEQQDYGHRIVDSVESQESQHSQQNQSSLTQRRDCCLNFLRNGFRRQPSCMPSQSSERKSTHALDIAKQGKSNVRTKDKGSSCGQRGL